jgi:hypothetical protein
MGMPLVVLLMLLLLGSIVVKPRTAGVRYGTAAVLGALMVALVAAMLLGYVSWGWELPPR